MAIEDRLHPWLRAYWSSPGWVRASVGRAYGLLPPGLRYGSAYAHFCVDLATWDAEGIRDLSRDRLDRTLRWALETVPAYREFRYLLSDRLEPEELLGHLPLLDKIDIKQRLHDYVSTAMPASARLLMHTGGSTAVPMRFFLHRGVSRPKEYAFMADFGLRVGLGERDVVLALRGRTVPDAQRDGGRTWMFEPIRRQLVFSTDHLGASHMATYMEALRRYKPRFIQAFPSALYPLARWLRENPAPDITERIRGVLLYSEMVFDFQMQLFHSVFHCPVLKHYGHSERVLMAASLPDDDCYYFWPHYGHFELIDVDGRPITRPGEVGEIVGTSFDNMVMPFIRYRTGDFGVLGEGEREDMPGFTSCSRIGGRLQEFIVTKDFRLISITTLGSAHFEELEDVEALRYEQQSVGRLTMKVVVRQPLSDDVRARLASAVHAKTQGGCEVDVVEVERLALTRQGKHQMLVQHLDLGRFFGALSEASSTA